MGVEHPFNRSLLDNDNQTNGFQTLKRRDSIFVFSIAVHQSRLVGFTTKREQPCKLVVQCEIQHKDLYRPREQQMSKVGSRLVSHLGHILKRRGEVHTNCQVYRTPPHKTPWVFTHRHKTLSSFILQAKTGHKTHKSANILVN